MKDFITNVLHILKLRSEKIEKKMYNHITLLNILDINRRYNSVVYDIVFWGKHTKRLDMGFLLTN